MGAPNSSLTRHEWLHTLLWVLMIFVVLMPVAIIAGTVGMSWWVRFWFTVMDWAMRTFGAPL